MTPFERNESEEDGMEIGDGGGIPTRDLWVHYEGSVSCHKGYLRDVMGQHEPPVYWFPDIGEPGFGTSISFGFGAFEKREDAVTAAKQYLEQQSQLLDSKKSRLP